MVGLVFRSCQHSKLKVRNQEAILDWHFSTVSNANDPKREERSCLRPLSTSFSPYVPMKISDERAIISPFLLPSCASIWSCFFWQWGTMFLTRTQSMRCWGAWCRYQYCFALVGTVQQCRHGTIALSLSNFLSSSTAIIISRRKMPIETNNQHRKSCS